MVVDFSIFESRFQVRGRLILETAMRVGAGGGGGATEQDLPVLKDLAGRPYIPGSSFKGAYRSHLERLLRSVDSRLACIGVPRAVGLGKAPGCLTQEDVAAIKNKYRNAPAEKRDRLIDKAILEGEVLTPEDEPGLKEDLKLTGPCWTCRLCGAPWLASKLMVRDMRVVEETWFDRYLIRDGVGIDRDKETAAEGLKYDFEAVPAGTEFVFEVVVDNATDAELGLALLGLREFEEGFVPLGGARSRGLGKVRLALDWDEALLVRRDGLHDYLLDRRGTVSLAREEERKALWQKFVEALNWDGGQNHAQATT